MSLSGNWGLGLWRVYLRESLQTGRPGAWPGAWPAAWHQPRQGGASRVSGACGRDHQQRRRLAGSCWRSPLCHGLEAALLCSPVWAAPRHLTLPLWAGFLDRCQGRERSLGLICAITTTEAEARHLEMNAFPTSGTVSLAQQDLCVFVCLEIKRINNTTERQTLRLDRSLQMTREVIGSSRFDLRAKPLPAPGEEKLTLGLLRLGHRGLDMVSAFCQGVLREIWV